MDDDERRLFYVALTRAKESVTITYAGEDEAKRETLPSAFIEEIRSELVEDLDTGTWEEKFKKDKQFQFAPTSPLPSPSQERGMGKDAAFVRDLFEKQGLSPTALNNYLECPWKYFYVNLIRIPTAQTIHQLYGIAVHCSLNDFFKRMKAEEASKEFLIQSFIGHINRQPVAPSEIESLQEKGTKALSGWYDTYENTWVQNTMTEYRINGILLDDTIKLTGVLDKLEFVDDGIVNVVDYKTGKPKTKNDIMGNTKSGDGNYYRQLVFYKMLLNHFNEGKISMQSGAIDFIEPNDKGDYKKEMFEITDGEVKDLEELIRKVSNEILNLEFWDKRCDDKDCGYCHLRNLIK